LFDLAGDIQEPPERLLKDDHGTRHQARGQRAVVT
jgi:hypothetical protein